MPAPRHSIQLKLLAAIAAAFVALASGVLPAHAQSDQQPQGGSNSAPPAVESWALSPSGDDPSQPGKRTDLSYQLQPGASIDDSVTLFNYGNTQLTFAIYSTDAFNTVTGSYELLAGDKTPTDVGTWVTVPQANITVPPQTSIVMPIKITVPLNASPGDHAGAILASSTIPGNDAQGHRVAVDRRTGTRLYVRVAGPLNPSLVIQDVKTDYGSGWLNPTHGHLKVTYTVRNVGNVRLAGHQKVTVKGFELVNVKSKTFDDLPELLPGNQLTVTEDLTGVLAAVRLRVIVSVTPFSANGAVEGAASRYTASSHVWAVPWSALVVLALVVIAWRWRRRRSLPRA